MTYAKSKFTVAILFSIIFGSAITIVVYRYLSPSMEHSTQTEEPEVLFWYDPMKPDVKFDKPGKSPFMDMDLVPKYRDKADINGEIEGVRINPVLLQNLGTSKSGVLPMGGKASSIKATSASKFWVLFCI